MVPSNVRDVQVISLLSQRRFLVQWQDNPETDITSYNIYRSEDQSVGYVLVGSVGIPSTQFIDTVPFTFGVNWFWKVTAINSSGQSDIDSSEPVTDTTVGRFDEEPFKQVQVQKTDLIFNETPMGLLDALNLTFTTLFPFRSGTLQLLENGLMQTQTGSDPDYIEFMNGTGFTVAAALTNTATIRVNYVKFVS